MSKDSIFKRKCYVVMIDTSQNDSKPTDIVSKSFGSGSTPFENSSTPSENYSTPTESNLIFDEMASNSPSNKSDNGESVIDLINFRPSMLRRWPKNSISYL